jgi:hypothetical protein
VDPASRRFRLRRTTEPRRQIKCACGCASCCRHKIGDKLQHRLAETPAGIADCRQATTIHAGGCAFGVATGAVPGCIHA